MLNRNITAKLKTAPAPLSVKTLANNTTAPGTETNNRTKGRAVVKMSWRYALPPH